MPAPEQSEPQIELNQQFQRALDIMENTDGSIFVTGRAGTGKSTLLSYFRQNTRKQIVVLAPTGVAALNVKGQTIHSFFRFKPSITLKLVRALRSHDDEDSIYQNLDAIVIDEISMVRADLLDCVDKFLRLNGPSAGKPFGGIQMIFVGDLYQLPPVVAGSEKAVFNSFYQTPYFYGAKVFDSFVMEFVELEKIYRQHDEGFINLLNGIRNRSITDEGLAFLNQRYMPEFEPSLSDFYVHLTTTNQLAEQVNTRQLAKLKSKPYTFTGSIDGDFGAEYLPTATDLQVKAGAQIMMLNNDAEGRWVNGSIGKITRVVQKKHEDDIIIAELADGEEVEITPFVWEIYKFSVEKGQLQSEVVGTFRQYPLMLAWAVTIHKSQGKTFDRVIIDIGRGTFAHGQTYVALSRCTTLGGIILKKPIAKNHILTDYKVMDFLTKYQYKKAEQACSTIDKIKIIQNAIKSKTALRIVYLKPSDEKTRRTIKPLTVGEMEYNNKKYLGVRAFCLKRNEERTFRVDRILEMEEANEAKQPGNM
ncbi:MAG: WYL domain-containing protein [Chloroflexi bacterium]|nr:WYL domain-containing protein [Chloroflexota bacterium]